MRKRSRLSLTGVASCLVLAAAWGILALPGPTIANPPPHDHGGGGDDAIHGCITLRDFFDTDLTTPPGPPFDDGVLSDGFGAYCDGVDFTDGALLSFFRFTMKVKKNRGRSLDLDFTDFINNGLDPSELPAEQNLWIIGIHDFSLEEWRAQTLNAGIERPGKIRFGKGGDLANVLYGLFGHGTSLTVTRISTDPAGMDLGEDLWTIESFPGDTAVFARGQGPALGVGSMPFEVLYDGTL